MTAAQKSDSDLVCSCGLHVVANTPAWNAVVFIWYWRPTTHRVSKYTCVNMTARKGLSFLWSLVKFDFSLCLFDRGCVSSLLIPFCVSANFHIKNSVDMKPFGQGSPAVLEASLVVTAARTKGRRTRAASPRWEEGGHVMGCCRSRFSPVWELQG